MRSQRLCELVEVQPAQWFLFLEHSDAEGCWDWREEAQCVGPFPSQSVTLAYFKPTRTRADRVTVTPYDPLRPLVAGLEQWIAAATAVPEAMLEVLKEAVREVTVMFHSAVPTSHPESRRSRLGGRRA
jgi:hypothetical protein